VLTGCQAIHDLSLHSPEVFVPEFGVLLPVVLNNLLAPTLVMRSQATLALGGFAKAYASIYASSTSQEEFASDVLEILFRPSPAKSPSKLSSPAVASPTKDSQLVRTLRTTLQALDPNHAAQGPVWALCTISSLIVLLGHKASRDERAGRVIRALLNVAMRHRRSSVRALTCVVWRVVGWSWFISGSPKSPESREDTDSDEEDEVQQKMAVEMEQEEKARDAWWELVRSVLDMGAGAGVVVSLLNEHLSDGEEDEWNATYGNDQDKHRRENLARSLDVLNGMARKGGQTTGQAIDLLTHIMRPYVTSLIDGEEETLSRKECYKGWSINKMLPHSLFSANPGLLSVEWRGLVAAVRTVLDECPSAEDVRPLTKEELANNTVFNSIVDSWRDAITAGTGDTELDPVTGAVEILSVRKNLQIDCYFCSSKR
jgi:hypothetical protein